jgi:hypothetical protein
MIPQPLASFLEEGIGVHLGSRSAQLEPNGVRAVAVKVEERGRHLLVYVPRVFADLVMPDLQSNGQGTVLFGRPVDERSVQVKGRFVDARDGRDDERDLVLSQWEGYIANLGLIGIPRFVYDRCPTWPVVAIRLHVTAVFEQTPGPGAGEPIR